MKIAIIGAGISGLACALECEKLGVIPDVFEKSHSVGWIWPSVSFWPSVMMRKLGDVRTHLKDEYGIDLTPITDCRSIILKSPDQEVKIEGKLGYLVVRGKGEESLENQLVHKLKKTAVHFNSPADYNELAKKYDFVVIAVGRDKEARELGVWKDEGIVRIVGAVAISNFTYDSSTLYLNTEYAGSGYARISPFSSSEAIVGLYDIGHGEFELEKLFTKFIEKEGLQHLDFTYKLIPPPYTTGSVKNFRIGNILLVGRAAGLTERLMGVGGPDSIMSGVLAARAMIQGLDYDLLMKPLQTHVENVSAFRKKIESFENKDYDKLLSFLSRTIVKSTVYNTGINFADMIGSILKRLQK